MDYIRKSEVLERIRCYPVVSETELTPMTQGIWIAGVVESREQIAEGISEIPAADVAPVVHGRWELHANDDDTGCSYFCSRCSVSYDEDWFYDHGRFVPFKGCPNCFARMDGELNDGT